jgi:DNA-directed RNA polymerase specialized sigma24 family protein
MDGQPPGEQTTTLRPFVITSGRVSGPDPNIGMETQVTASYAAAPARLPPEKRAIVTLCVEPLSVAEISARLKMHLGVTRILVGDLRAAGQLDVHVLENDFPDPETIMRVIRGLRAIS